jgi:hypothetical protein
VLGGSGHTAAAKQDPGAGVRYLLFILLSGWRLEKWAAKNSRIGQEKGARRRKIPGIGLAKGEAGLSFQPFPFLKPITVNCSYDRKAAQLADLCLVTT